MKPLSASPTLVEQVHAAVMGEVATGRLKPGERIIQEQIAQQLGVSRQPVQQALILLHKQGVLREAPGRGLQVAPLDLDHVEHVYAIRAAIEGMACRRAAEVGGERAARLGPA
ncbi:MAG: GntR family transcriptional regulator, partial [Aquabacterium sp.]